MGADERQSTLQRGPTGAVHARQAPPIVVGRAPMERRLRAVRVARRPTTLYEAFIRLLDEDGGDIFATEDHRETP
ncbi:hypothetical protein [Aquisalimonas sp.]|uniref:hypothetical protein n=1 Tax=Aquisalimonas sp. TaxID=1872621 RepID=UPI0025B85E7E|nr:hypothetical protein [Aquisalimonas sp.]